MSHIHALPGGFRLARGRYTILSVLGSGTFGITYKASQENLGRMVAIKELFPSEYVARRTQGGAEVQVTTGELYQYWEWAQERFLEEAQALSQCEGHPHILQVIEIFSANGTHYMVTRFEEGCNLESWLRQLGRRPNETELRNILLPLLSALHAVHRIKLLHRDIKPDNIYMTGDGRPILLDFGNARRITRDRSRPVTAIVADGYSPLEQYSEEESKDLGAWTDLYALGAVMYRAIEGEKPPSASTRWIAERNKRTDPCRSLVKTRAKEYSKPLLAGIDAALSLSHESRPRTASEWTTVLEARTHHRTGRTPTIAGPQWDPDHWKVAALGSACVAVAGTLAYVVLAGPGRSKPTPDPAPPIQTRPTPTDLPTPAPEPQPVPTSTPRPTPPPTPIPDPTPTLLPTATPIPTPTSAPTPTLVPTPVPRPDPPAPRYPARLPIAGDSTLSLISPKSAEVNGMGIKLKYSYVLEYDPPSTSWMYIFKLETKLDRPAPPLLLRYVNGTFEMRGRNGWEKRDQLPQR